MTLTGEVIASERKGLMVNAGERTIFDRVLIHEDDTRVAHKIFGPVAHVCSIECSHLVGKRQVVLMLGDRVVKMLTGMGNEEGSRFSHSAPSQVEWQDEGGWENEP